MPGPNDHRTNPRTGKRFSWEWEQEQKRLADPEAQRAEIEAELALLERQHRAKEAGDHLLAFTEFTMPDPQNPNDVKLSAYDAQGFHRKVADVLTLFEKGELKHADGRPCAQVIFAMPPRHGKTEMATKRNAAWISGRHPDWNIAVASYSDTMATDFGADTRAILTSPQFRQVFPDYKLRRGGTAKDNIQTEKGGRLVFVGRGGALTGRGAHCLPGDTVVETKNGPKYIREVLVGEKVLSYDFRAGSIVWRRVESVAERSRARLFRITDSAGRVVEATSDHRFYTDAGWREAAQLAPGDRLLCAMRDHERAASGGHCEAFSETEAQRVLLQQRLLGAGDEYCAPRGSDVHAVRGPSAQEVVVRGQQKRANFLLEGVHGGRAAGGIGYPRVGADGAVRAVQRYVRPSKQRAEVLLSGLREPGALSIDAGREQPALEERRVQGAVNSACGAALPGNAPDDTETRRGKMRSLLRGERIGGASSGREPAEQPSGQPRDAVPPVPHEGPLFRRGTSTVVSVEDVRREAVVYDLQVEETENFFANGVLCHNCLLIDDLYKDHEEARSQTIRDQAWNWFTKVAMTRRMGRKLVMITMTRWHSDDIVGRLTDPENPCYDAMEAKNWMIIRIPAVAEDDDPLGRPPGAALWPERYDLDFLAQQQRIDPLGFAALYQQRPTVADGVLFRRENIQRYDPADLPENLRFYAASDHAVGTKQRNDPSCFGLAGVDKQDNLWLTDLFWQRVPTDRAVEAMMTMASGTNRPLLWWAERGHISQSIGPFLYKRMQETGQYINIVEVTPVGDKEQRAQSIAARVAMGKVFIPKGGQWDKAVEEMLAFPNGIHDDFVDMLSLLGLGLASQFGRRTAAPVKKAEPQPGTLAWMKHQEALAEKHRRAAGGGF